MEQINKTLESLIKGGFIGASLGSMLLSDQEEGLTFGLQTRMAFFQAAPRLSLIMMLTGIMFA